MERFKECPDCKRGEMKEHCTCEDMEIGFISMLCFTCGCFYNEELEKEKDK